jgi:hypothetical protein
MTSSEEGSGSFKNLNIEMVTEELHASFGQDITVWYPLRNPSCAIEKFGSDGTDGSKGWFALFTSLLLGECGILP